MNDYTNFSLADWNKFLKGKLIFFKGPSNKNSIMLVESVTSWRQYTDHGYSVSGFRIDCGGDASHDEVHLGCTASLKENCGMSIETLDTLAERMKANTLLASKEDVQNLVEKAKQLAEKYEIIINFMLTMAN